MQTTKVLATAQLNLEEKYSLSYMSSMTLFVLKKSFLFETIVILKHDFFLKKPFIFFPVSGSVSNDKSPQGVSQKSN